MDCLTLLQRDLSHKKSWVFIGSAEIASLTYYASMQFMAATTASRKKDDHDDSDGIHQNGWNVTTRRNSCQNLMFYQENGLPSSRQQKNGGWLLPDPNKGEGPTQYGKQHPWCMDCRNCWNVMLQQRHPSSSSQTPSLLSSKLSNPPSSLRSSSLETPYDPELQTLEYLAVEVSKAILDSKSKTLSTNISVISFSFTSMPEM
jgi:hypothetical protein